MKTKCAYKPKGPRLHCDSQWQNGFYGTYKGCGIAIERDHPMYPFVYLIIGIGDTAWITGRMDDKRATLRETVLHALKTAGLYP